MNAVLLPGKPLPQKPKGYMPLNIGGREILIAGGPYVHKPKGYFGVKMAREINLPCEINIPTEDYQTPAKEDARLGLIRVIPELLKGTPIYVGCMGGIGRTGLFLGLLARLANPSRKFDARAYVRGSYLGHAIETPEQEKFVREFPLADISRYLTYYQSLTKRRK